MSALGIDRLRNLHNVVSHEVLPNYAGVASVLESVLADPIALVDFDDPQVIVAFENWQAARTAANVDCNDGRRHTGNRLVHPSTRFITDHGGRTAPHGDHLRAVPDLTPAERIAEHTGRIEHLG